MGRRERERERERERGREFKKCTRREMFPHCRSLRMRRQDSAGQDSNPIPPDSLIKVHEYDVIRNDVMHASL